MNSTEIATAQAVKDEERRLENVAVEHVCSECGGRLRTPWDGEKIILVCSRNKEHKGYVKFDPVIQRINLMRPTIGDEEADKMLADYLVSKQKARGKKDMSQEQSIALAKYNSVTALTDPVVTDILRIFWPKAPAEAVARAASICVSYQLDPRLKHLYLMPFKNKDSEGSTWEPIIGINATRLMAARNGGVSYVDGPRAMGREEQEDTLGEYDPDRIWVITKVQKGNNIGVGYGNWPKSAKPYGEDKGNTKFNMASIRSERQALSRACPGEIPANVIVEDDQYLDDSHIPPTISIVDTPPTSIPLEDKISRVRSYVKGWSQPDTLAWVNRVCGTTMTQLLPLDSLKEDLIQILYDHVVEVNDERHNKRQNN